MGRAKKPVVLPLAVAMMLEAMSNSVRAILGAAASAARAKAFGRPSGIVFACACLLYASVIFSEKLFILFDPARRTELSILEGAATWAILAMAWASLLRRRLIARMFGGMAMTLLLFHSIFHSDNLGIALAIVCLACLIANRRWYDERLPMEN